jgi:hypothetical protein
MRGLTSEKYEKKSTQKTHSISTGYEPDWGNPWCAVRQQKIKQSPFTFLLSPTAKIPHKVLTSSSQGSDHIDSGDLVKKYRNQEHHTITIAVTLSHYH